jgi:hypothetical protein
MEPEVKARLERLEKMVAEIAITTAQALKQVQDDHPDEPRVREHEDMLTALANEMHDATVKRSGRAGCGAIPR